MTLAFSKVLLAGLISLAASGTVHADDIQSPANKPQSLGPITETDQLPFTPNASNIAMDASGVSIAVWSSRAPSGPDGDIFYARSTDFGTTWSAAAPLNPWASSDFSSSEDFDPTIATNGNGTWIAVWTRGPTQDLYYRRSTDGGMTWSAPSFVVIPADAFFDNDASIAYLGGTTWLIAWRSTKSLNGTIGTDYDILASRSTDDGATWSGLILVNTTASVDLSLEDFSPRIAGDGSGTNAVIVWASKALASGGPGGTRHILAAKSISGGATWSAPVDVDPRQPQFVHANRPSIAHVDGFGWFAAWNTDNPFPTPPSVALAHSDDGLTWAMLDPLAQDVGREFSSASLSSASGVLLGSWAGHGAEKSNGLIGGPDADILFKQSSDGGVTWSEPRAVNVDGAGDRGGDFVPHLASVATRSGIRSIALWRRSAAVDTPTYEMRAVALSVPDCDRGADCNSDGLADECTLELALDVDCDADGVPDSCAAEMGDVDDDGVLDSCAIASGAVEDCDNDGVPDARQLDGTYVNAQQLAGATISWGGNPQVLLEGHRIVAGLETIHAASITWGPFTVPGNAAVLLYADPNGDFNPSDATLLLRMPFSPRGNPSETEVIEIPPTVVGAAGQTFFVGFEGSGNMQIADGPTSRSGRSWGIMGASGYDPEHPTVNGTADRLEDIMNAGANFPFAALATTSLDVDGDGVIDACVAVPADLNGDGAVSAADLGVLLGAWGACPNDGSCAADLDHDGVVGAADLAILLGAWTR